MHCAFVTSCSIYELSGSQWSFEVNWQDGEFVVGDKLQYSANGNKICVTAPFYVVIGTLHLSIVVWLLETSPEMCPLQYLSNALVWASEGVLSHFFLPLCEPKVGNHIHCFTLILMKVKTLKVCD